MPAQFPSKSSLRDQKRKDREFEEAAQRERYAALDTMQNAERESLKGDVEALPDNTEDTATLKRVLRYLLERASD
jgi:hypothetical protein